MKQGIHPRMLINEQNASEEQKRLFQNLKPFLDDSKLMEFLLNKLFMNKDRKISVQFQSELGRSFVQKKWQENYAITLSADARAIDTLFDFIHALYDIDRNTFSQESKSYISHRFNVFRDTYSVIEQMIKEKSADFNLLAIDKTDQEHFKNAIPGQVHKEAKLKGGSVTKDFDVKTMDEEEKEYTAVSKDESGSSKITIFNKKPEYMINKLKQPEVKVDANEIKKQVKQASNTQAFVFNGQICCGICASGGEISIVTKTNGGYYCARGGYISEMYVIDAQKNVKKQPEQQVVQQPEKPASSVKGSNIADMQKQIQESSVSIQRTNVDARGDIKNLKNQFEQQQPAQQEPIVRTPKTPVFKKPETVQTEQPPQSVQENNPKVAPVMQPQVLPIKQFVEPTKISPPQKPTVEKIVEKPVQQPQKVNYENKSTAEILVSILSGEITGEEDVHNAVFTALEKTRNINKNEVNKMLNLAMKNKPNPNYDAKQKIEEETNKFFKAKAGKK